jgi:hypothetical protein
MAHPPEDAAIADRGRAFPVDGGEDELLLCFPIEDIGLPRATVPFRDAFEHAFEGLAKVALIVFSPEAAVQRYLPLQTG